MGHPCLDCTAVVPLFRKNLLKLKIFQRRECDWRYGMASIHGTAEQAETLQPKEMNPWLQGHEGLQSHDWNGEHE